MEGFDSLVRYAAESAKAWSHRRLSDHSAFLEERGRLGKPVRHENPLLGLPVMTRQESELMLYEAERIVHRPPATWIVDHVPVEYVAPQVQNHG